MKKALGARLRAHLPLYFHGMAPKMRRGGECLELPQMGVSEIGVQANPRISEQKAFFLRFLDFPRAVRKRPILADFQEGRPDTPWAPVCYTPICGSPKCWGTPEEPPEWAFSWAFAFVSVAAPLFWSRLVTQKGAFVGEAQSRRTRTSTHKWVHEWRLEWAHEWTHECAHEIAHESAHDRTYEGWFSCFQPFKDSHESSHEASHEGVHGSAHENVQSSGRGSPVLFSPALFVGHFAPEMPKTSHVAQDQVGCTPRGSCNKHASLKRVLRRALRRLSKCFLEGFLEGACEGFQ